MPGAIAEPKASLCADDCPRSSAGQSSRRGPLYSSNFLEPPSQCLCRKERLMSCLPAYSEKLASNNSTRPSIHFDHLYFAFSVTPPCSSFAPAFYDFKWIHLFLDWFWRSSSGYFYSIALAQAGRTSWNAQDCDAWNAAANIAALKRN